MRPKSGSIYTCTLYTEMFSLGEKEKRYQLFFQSYFTIRVGVVKHLKCDNEYKLTLANKPQGDILLTKRQFFWMMDPEHATVSVLYKELPKSSKK